MRTIRKSVICGCCKQKVEVPIMIQNKKSNAESTIISMRIQKDLLMEIDEVVSKTGNSRNEVLQMCLRFAMDNLQVQTE